MGAGFGGGGVGVFGWAEQPEETDDDEVVSDGVEDAPLGVVEVEGVGDATDDGEVDRVGSVFGFVVALESSEEIHEYGPEGSVSLLSGIWLTQVGDVGLIDQTLRDATDIAIINRISYKEIMS